MDSRDQEQAERRKVETGVDAEAFMATKLGKYILDRCEREEMKAIEDLIIAASKCTDPEIQQLSTDIFRLRSIPMFIQDAIKQGSAAIQNLDLMDAYDQENEGPGGFRR